MSDEVSGYPGAPPGWYADPAGGPGQRWWDGYAWTDTTVQPEATPPPAAASPEPPTLSAPPAPPPPPPYGYGSAPHGGGPPPYGYGSGSPPYGAGSPYGTGSTTPPPHYGTGQPWAVGPPVGDARLLLGGELRLVRWARIAIALPSVGTLYYLANAVANASQWRAFGHQYRLVIQAAENHETAPTLTAPSSLGGGLYGLIVLLTLVAAILELVWQYRAASTARALRFPAKRSPGWGVGFWFIPVVNLWMPYQAIRDCLPPADPNRALVLRYWLLWIGAGVASFFALTGLMFSTPVGEVFAAVAAACAIGILFTAPRVVVAIATAHRAAVTP